MTDLLNSIGYKKLFFNVKYKSKYKSEIQKFLRAEREKKIFIILLRKVYNVIKRILLFHTFRNCCTYLRKDTKMLQKYYKKRENPTFQKTPIIRVSRREAKRRERRQNKIAKKLLTLHIYFSTTLYPRECTF